MIQLNLLPDVKKEFLQARATRRKAISLSIIVSMVSVGILVLLGMVLLGQKAATAMLTSQIKSKAEELAAVENIDEYLTIQAQLAEIDGLHASKLNSSRLTQILPRLNPAHPNSVRFSSVALETETTAINFQGGVRSVSALTTFKDTLINAQLSYTVGDSDSNEKVNEPLFSSVDITEYGYSAQNENANARVGFTIVAVYNPKLFDTTAKNIAVSVPSMETTQSVVASPEVTFEEGAGRLEGGNE